MMPPTAGEVRIAILSGIRLWRRNRNVVRTWRRPFRAGSVHEGDQDWSQPRKCFHPTLSFRVATDGVTLGHGGHGCCGHVGRTVPARRSMRTVWDVEENIDSSTGNHRDDGRS